MTERLPRIVYVSQGVARPDWLPDRFEEVVELLRAAGETDVDPYVDDASVDGLLFDREAGAHLLARVRRHRREDERLSTLHEIDQAIIAAQTVEDIANAALDRLARLVPYQRASLTLFDLERGEARAIVTGDPATRHMKLPIERVYDLIERLRQRETYSVTDLQTVEAPSTAERVWRDQGVRAYVMLPLVVGETLIGSLNVGAAEVGGYAEDDLQIMREIADQLAIALHQSQMREQLDHYAAELESRVEARTRELSQANERLRREIDTRERAQAAEHEQRLVAEALRDIATALNSTLDLEDILDRVLANVGRVVAHDGIDIMLLDEATLPDDASPINPQQVRARVARAYGAVERGLRPMHGPEALAIAERPHLLHMFTMRNPLLIADTTASDLWPVVPVGAPLAWIGSYTGAPILIAGQVAGFINVYSAEPGFYAPAHLERLRMFTDQAAIAVRNARNYEQAVKLAMIEDRQRLARDLHDAVSQTLFSASVVAETTLRGWARSPEKVQPKLEQLNRLTRGALAEMRTLLLELRPSALEETPLNELVRQLAEAFTGRSQGTIGVEVYNEGDLPARVKVEVYRILQEALNNISKHARADRVRITITYRRDGLELSIQDNGRGFDSQDIDHRQMGLHIMRERARSIGADLEINTRPGEGTQVRVVWRKQDHDEPQSPE